MNTYQIHIDTAAAVNVTTVTNSPGQASISKINGNPFQCTAILGNRHRAIRSAALKDAQIPVGFYNIRAPYNSIIINGITYTLPPGNYTINSLVNTLNGVITNTIGTFAASSVTNQISFVSNNGPAVITVPSLSLGAFLGFTNGQSCPGTNTVITGTNSYIINFDTYITIWIGEIGTASLDPQQITYKVPLTTGSGTIIQYSEGSTWPQKVIYTDRSNRLDRLTIVVLDRFGNIINNNGIDWSFTLEIESDT
jgi:hypothetical protein